MSDHIHRSTTLLEKDVTPSNGLYPLPFGSIPTKSTSLQTDRNPSTFWSESLYFHFTGLYKYLRQPVAWLSPIQPIPPCQMTNCSFQA